MIRETRVFIILASSAAVAREALLRYGVSDIEYPADPDVIVAPEIIIATPGVIPALDVPSDTPWCVAGEPPLGASMYMVGRFGAPQTISACVALKNDEYAMRPGRKTI